MPLRTATRTAAAAACLLAVTACGQVADTASRASDCVDLARDVAASGLSGSPTREEAEQAVQRLDERVQTLDDPEVRAAAEALRDRLRELREAAASADPAAAQEAAESAREAAREAASACSLPVDQFLG